MNSAASSYFLCLVLAAAAIACDKPAPEAPAPPQAAAVAAPAGTVEALEGRVTARRAGAPAAARALALRDSIWADDTVTTAAEAAVSIRLAHNHALWQLQGGQTRRVDEAAAWRAPKQAAAVALADHQEAPTTLSAGRHSELEAAQTAESATRPVAAPAQVKAGDDAQRAANDDRKRKIMEGVKKQGVLAIIDTKGRKNQDLKDAFGTNSGTGFGDLGGNMDGVGVSGLSKGKRTRGAGSGIAELGTAGGGAPVDLRIQSDVVIKVEVLQGSAEPKDLEAFSALLKVRARAAYERALKANPTLRGTVVVVSKHAGDHVTDVEVVSKEAEQGLVDCVVGPLKTWRRAGLDGVQLKIVAKFDVGR